MLLTFSLLLIFHLAQFTKFRGGLHPQPLAVTPMKVELACSAASRWFSFDARLLCHFTRQIWGMGYHLPIPRLPLSTSHFPLPTVTPINKFIELINNCNTVADCSLNGNGNGNGNGFAGNCLESFPSGPALLHFKCHWAKCSLIMLVFFNKLISHTDTGHILDSPAADCRQTAVWTA